LNTVRPWALRAIKGKGAALAGLVEVINLGIPIFSPEAELVCSLGPGKRVVDVAGNVITSGVDRDPDGIETVVGCAQP